MSDRMVIEFSGWIECDPAKTTFQYIGGEAIKNELGLLGSQKENAKLLKQYDADWLLGQDFNSHIITGEEYMALTEDEKDCYILEDLGQAYMNSLDGELNELTLDIEVENEQVR